MSSDRFLLWGIDGQLTGSEHLLQMRLPLFTREGDDDVVYIARRVGWSTPLPESDVERVPVERAEEYGDRLDVMQEVTIAPSELVVVIGPKLIKNLLGIDLKLGFGSMTVDGFSVTPLPVAKAEQAANFLEEYARRRFDVELTRGFVTQEARAALAVMRDVGVGDLRSHLIRSLATHRLDNDTDQYRRVLRLAQVRLRDRPNVLENEVLQHIALTRKPNYLAEVGETKLWSRAEFKKLTMNVSYVNMGELGQDWNWVPNEEYFKGAIPASFETTMGKKFVNPKLFFLGVSETDDDSVNIPFLREDG